MSQETGNKDNPNLAHDRARCPGCGVPTVPDHQDLTYTEMLCDFCEASLVWSET